MNETYEGVAICHQPILWKEVELVEDENNSGEYIAKAPIPQTEGNWMAYYANLYFEGDTSPINKFSTLTNEYAVTSIAWMNPNTYPFADCEGKGCKGIML